MLALFEAQDRSDFVEASTIALKVLQALIPDTADASQNTLSLDSLIMPVDIALSISQNPLIKMEFLLELEKVRIQSIIDSA